MIDIHTHILPGIDDGAKDIEESLKMAQIAANDGITRIIATPHVITGLYENKKQDIIKAVAILNTQLTKQHIPVEILPGAEYRLEPELPRQLSRGELLTLNNSGRYLLVELPDAFIPKYTEDVLYQIQLQGITPVIAHPERNMILCKDPGRLKELILRGMTAQVTTSSITGAFGTQPRKSGLYFIKQQLIHIIASDAHSCSGRIPELKACSQIITQRFGQQTSRVFFRENPERICSAKDLITPEIADKNLWSHRIKNLFLKNQA